MKPLLFSLLLLMHFNTDAQKFNYNDNLKKFQQDYIHNHEVVKKPDWKYFKFFPANKKFRVLAVFEKRDENTDIQTAGKITLVLDTIQDPGNLGTIIRIADWFGVTDIICSEGCADMYNPKVVQSTMGSLGRVNIVYTDLANWLKENKQVNIYSATLKGKDIATLGKLKEGILIIGNEANGISDEVMQLVNEKITIPKIGKAESLNAAVATGIILALIR